MWNLKTKEMNKHNKTEKFIDTDNKQVVVRGRWVKEIKRYKVPVSK